MKTEKLVAKITEFFNLKKKKQEKEIEKLIKLRKELKEKRTKLNKKLKDTEGSEHDDILAELQAIDNLRKKAKKVIENLD